MKLSECKISLNVDSFRLLPFISAALCFYFTVLVFFPGHVTQDSYNQFHQVVTNTFNNYHPAIMARLWSITNSFIYGPGGIFLVHIIVYWISILLIAISLSRNTLVRTLIVFLFGLFPPVWMISIHVWKDAGLLCFLLLAVGCILTYLRYQKVALLFGAFFAVSYVLGVRHNSVLATIPIYIYLSVLVAKHFDYKFNMAKMVGFTILLSMLFVSPVLFVNNFNVQKNPNAAPILMWDMAVISVEKNRLVIPDHLIGDKVDSLPKLRQRTFPYSGYQVGAVVEILPDGDYFNHWLKAIVENPVIYLKHRLRVFERLLGIYSVEPNAFSPGIDKDRNERYHFKSKAIGSALHNQVMSFGDLFTKTPLYPAWTYLLFLIVFLFSSRKRVIHCLNGDYRSERVFAYVLSLSAILYVAPYFAFAPCTDYRFLAWLFACFPVVAMIIIKEKIKERVGQ